MTNEEAIITITTMALITRCQIEDAKNEDKVIEGIDEMIEEIQEATRIAVKALEKQTAKKPYRIHDNIFHCGNDKNCDAFFTEADEYRYCPFCGQKILWEDYE